MWNRKIRITVISLVVIALGLFALRVKQKKASEEVISEITPARGTIQSVISTTGTVLPKNRLEVKPPVNGRVEEILVREGEKVKAGQTLAWMSSTERAALLDAARGKGEEAFKYWQDAYKPIPLISPIDGEIIVATTQPGQTVTTGDAMVVLSDHLIVRAQVDETDIGKVKSDQKAIVSLDAYPNVKISAGVEHIYYESKTVNNVTIYEVDLLPDEVPRFFRSGMNATVDFIEQSREDALLVPVEAIHKEKGETFVYVKQGGNKEFLKRDVEVGISDGKNTEILSGIDMNDRIAVKTKKFVLPKGNAGGSPFMPSMRR